MKSLFASLKWYQASELALLFLTAIIVPISWHWGVVCLELLAAHTVVKVIASRHIGNPALSRQATICVGLMVLLYLLYSVSTAYSSDRDTARVTLFTMLPMLLFPLIFLISDTSYLNRRHIRAFTYILAATVTLRFLFLLPRFGILYLLHDLMKDSGELLLSSIAMAPISLFRGTALEPLAAQVAYGCTESFARIAKPLLFDHVKTPVFDTLHHNYLSVYINTAIALLYTELLSRWHNPRFRRLRWWLIADIALMVFYVVFSGSRSGVVVMFILCAASLLHLGWWHRQWRVACIAAVAFAAVIGCAYLVSPNAYKRAKSVSENVASGEEGDARQGLWKSGLLTAKERPLIGYGCDGYWDELIATYRANDCKCGYSGHNNTHNQYIETTLNTGIVGLLVLLSILALPFAISLKPPKRNLPMLLFIIIIAPSMMFEVTLARQMGLLFICFWYPLLLHRPNSC